MTTIAEGVFTPAELIDSIASAALGFAPWSEPASGDVANDQSTNDWYNNARLLYHADANLYVLMYVPNTGRCFYDSYFDHNGVRMVFSNDWNTSEVRPAGWTTTGQSEPFAGDVGNHYNASTTYYNMNDDRQGPSLGALNARARKYTQANIDDRIDVANLFEFTAYGSVGADHFALGAYSHDDATQGSAAFIGWEHLGSKFWDDGNDPWVAMWGTGGNSDWIQGQYSWAAADYSGSSNSLGRVGAIGGEARLGHINPASDDDTYFFLRPVVYQNENKQEPVGFFKPLIMNDTFEGGAHGDIVSYDGVDYRIMQQSGAGRDKTVSVGVRYT